MHKARLRETKAVVAVKLLRENIQFQVRIDILLLNLFLRIFRPLFTDQTRHSIESVLKAFSRVILQEVSMRSGIGQPGAFQPGVCRLGGAFSGPI